MPSAVLRRVLMPTPSRLGVAAMLGVRVARPMLLRGLSTMPPPPPPLGGNTQSIVEIKTPADFDTLCVQASATPPPVGGPVILDLYADWCEPCKQLTPKLEALVNKANGAVRLAKVNVDNLPEIAQALQVQSLPTVMLLHGGKLVDSFKGMLPDAELAKFMEKAIALGGGPDTAGPAALEAAAAALEDGDVPGATQKYAELMALPELAASARAGLALCALKDNNLALAQDLIAELHKTHGTDGGVDKPDVRRAISQVELAADAPDMDGFRPVGQLRSLLEANPKDHEARFELAQTLLGDGKQEEAMDELLLIVRRDKTWNERAAPTLLIKLFDSLGNEHELVKKGRRKLSNYLLL